MLTPEPTLTVDQVATRYGVTRDAVSGWIASKELPAVNVSRQRNAKKPRWRIRPEDLTTFELSRRTSINVKPERKRKPVAIKATRKWI